MNERRLQRDVGNASACGSYVANGILHSGFLEADSSSPGFVMRFIHGNDCPCYYCTYHMKTSGCIPSLESAKFIAWFNFWHSMEKLFNVKH